MRLLIKDFQFEIEFSEHQINVLIIEDPKLFTGILRDVWNQANGGDGGLLLSENGKEIIFGKTVEVVFNPFQLDINNRKMVSALYKDLSETAKDSMLIETAELNADYLRYFDGLIENYPYPVTYDDQIEISELFKAFKVRFDDSSDTLAEFVLNYFRMVSRVLGVRLFVFVGVKQYFSREELSFLYQSLFYEKIYLLDIESEQKDILKEEKTVTIDKDQCIIEL